MKKGRTGRLQRQQYCKMKDQQRRVSKEGHSCCACNANRKIFERTLSLSLFSLPSLSLSSLPSLALSLPLLLSLPPKLSPPIPPSPNPSIPPPVASPARSRPSCVYACVCPLGLVFAECHQTAGPQRHKRQTKQMSYKAS